GRARHHHAGGAHAPAPRPRAPARATRQLDRRGDQLMTDLLDQLADANPVRVEDLEVPAFRPAPQRKRPSRRGRLALAAGAGALGVVAVLALLPGRSHPPKDLAARAYAATSGDGIAHWRLVFNTYVGGKLHHGHMRVEGWARHGVVHELNWNVVPGKTRLE